ncbi:hypothetical protein BJY52DRAFT_1199379 [Lactarius psammicola]|nr:hypothetical protein BJY52DRAFT_1199379 [Lactarius psammicola]
MPLGTASVVEALHILAEKYTKGLGEVISWLGTGLYWVPKMGSKVYIVYDPFDAALNIVSKDLLIKRNATGVRRRIFRVILNHLTTSIVEIDVYLMNNPTPRTLIEDLSPFKSISTVAKDKGKGKATKNKTKSDALSPSTKEPVAMSEFLSAVNWTADRLKKEYDTIREMMSKHQFTRDNRLSNHRGTRLLTMCGLPWNPESQNKPRDFAMIATAVSVESAVVNTYRENLLGLCPGARALRKDLHSLFIEFAVPHSIQNDAGDDIIHCIWEFPDSISSDESADRHKPYNLKVLLDQWQSAHDTFVNDTKDPIMVAMQTLEKNRFLACSDPDAPPGAIETLAHHLITGLSEIMYKNRARIEHGADNSVPFKMDSVVVPVVLRKPHAQSTKYRNKLGYDNWSFKGSSSEKSTASPSTSSLVSQEPDKDRASPTSEGAPISSDSESSAVPKTSKSNTPFKHQAPSSPDDSRPIKKVAIAKPGATIPTARPKPSQSRGTSSRSRPKIVPVSFSDIPDDFIDNTV